MIRNIFDYEKLGPVLGPSWPYTHPLVERVTRGKSYDEWFRRWSTTSDFNERHGLLYALAENEAYWEPRSAVPFLLQLADGSNLEKSYFALPEERDCGYDHIIERQQKDRKALAQKARSILVSKFFKTIREQYKDPVVQWLWVLADEVVFRRVLWFFRTNNDSYPSTPNIPDSSHEHENEVVRSFLRDFVKTCWETKKQLSPGNTVDFEKTVQRLREARPQLVMIFWEIGELRWLIGRDIDGTSRKVIKDLVFTKDLSLQSETSWHATNYRKPKTLAEAVYGGSSAARMFLIHGIERAERRKTLNLKRRLKLQSEADAKVRQLARLNEERRKLDEQAAQLQAK